MNEQRQLWSVRHSCTIHRLLLLITTGTRSQASRLHMFEATTGNIYILLTLVYMEGTKPGTGDIAKLREQQQYRLTDLEVLVLRHPQQPFPVLFPLSVHISQ